MRDGAPLRLSVKLPHSGADLLLSPVASPTGYGLGKSGWVSASFPDDDLPPIEMMQAWIDESYRAQAPKKLIAQLDGGPAPKAAKKKTASKKQTKKRASRAK